MAQPDGTDISGRLEAIKATGGSAPVAKTAAYTVKKTDGPVLANGTFTVTLPAGTAALAGKRYTVKNTGSGSITVAATSGTIDGSATGTLAAGAAGDYISDGTNWFKI